MGTQATQCTPMADWAMSEVYRKAYLHICTWQTHEGR